MDGGAARGREARPDSWAAEVGAEGARCGAGAGAGAGSGASAMPQSHAALRMRAGIGSFTRGRGPGAAALWRSGGGGNSHLVVRGVGNGGGRGGLRLRLPLRGARRGLAGLHGIIGLALAPGGSHDGFYRVGGWGRGAGSGARDGRSTLPDDRMRLGCGREPAHAPLPGPGGAQHARRAQLEGRKTPGPGVSTAPPLPRRLGRETRQVSASSPRRARNGSGGRGISGRAIFDALRTQRTVGQDRHSGGSQVGRHVGPCGAARLRVGQGVEQHVREQGPGLPCRQAGEPEDGGAERDSYAFRGRHRADAARPPLLPLQGAHRVSGHVASPLR